MPAFTAAQAARIASRARKLLRDGRLSHHAYAVLDALLWAARAPGADTVTASYSRLQQLARVARATVASAITSLENLGLVQRRKRRTLVLWHNGGRAWRQLSSQYRFHCEFSARPEYKGKTEIITLSQSVHVVSAAQTALAAVRSAMQERLLRTKRRRGAPTTP